MKLVKKKKAKRGNVVHVSSEEPMEDNVVDLMQVASGRVQIASAGDELALLHAPDEAQGLVGKIAAREVFKSAQRRRNDAT